MIVTPRAFTCAAFTGDTTPPTTTVSLTPPAPNGGGGWYVSPVTVAVSADDGPGGTVVETRCALDPAVPPTTFAQLPAGCPYGGAGSSVATQGQHTLYAASLDANGNAGAPVSASFGIDSTAPTATVSLSPPTPNGAAGWYTSPVTVAVSAADAVGTVAELRCVLDPAIVPAAFGDLPSGCPFAGAGGAVSGGGPHSVYAAAIDAAGHAGTPVSVTFRIDSAPPTTTVTLTPPTPNGAAGWYHVARHPRRVGRRRGGYGCRNAMRPRPDGSAADVCPTPGGLFVWWPRGFGWHTRATHSLCREHRRGRKRGYAGERDVPHRRRGADDERVAHAVDTRRQ